MDGQLENEISSDGVTPSDKLNSMNQLNVDCVESMEQASDVIESPANKWTNLRLMNDYSLLDIFSVKSLSVMDLCSIAETCKRFQQMILRIVPKDIHILSNFNSSGQNYIKFRDHLKTNQNDIERIFKNFGSRLSTVKIESWPCNTQEDHFLFNLIAEHCDIDNLKNLAILSSVTIPDVLTPTLKPVFQKLQKLQLRAVKVMRDTTIFAEMISLVELHVDYVENWDAILKNDFPQLERFRFSDKAGKQSLLTFISRHTQLKRLHLHVVNRRASYGKNILQTIGKNCKKLQYLNLLVCVGSNLQPLQTIKLLRTLSLRGVSFTNLGFFSKFTKLRQLNLEHCKLPNDSAQFASWNQLTKLKLSECGTSTDTVGIISRLPNLEILEILSTVILDRKTFYRVLSTIKGRPQVLTLRCQINFIPENVNGNRRVRLIRL